MSIGKNLVPMLDGAILTRTRSGFVYADGTPVPEARRKDILFVAPADVAQHTRTEPPDIGLLDALRAIGEAPAPVEEVEAGFFHRTLARWLGLPEGRAKGQEHAPLLWDYAFWKAELLDAGLEEGRRLFQARIHRSADGPCEIYRYWVDLDDNGRIRASGWIGNPPRLLHDTPDGFPPAKEADKAALEALYRDEP